MTEPARMLDDDSRVTRLRLGDPDTTRDTLRALLPLVRRWMYRLLGRTADLDDATQDALSEIASFLPRFEGRAKLETAAYQIAVRVAYRYFARAKDVSLEVVPEIADDAAPTDTRMMAREVLLRLHRCLGRLPVKRRVAFVLCAIEGMTPSEAARVAGTTGLAMRCRLLYARREIARMLKCDPYLACWVQPQEEP